MAIVEVFPHPRKQRQLTQTLDKENNTLHTQIIEWWIVRTDNIQTQPVDLLGASDGTHTLPIVSHSYALGLSGTVAVCDQVNIQHIPESQSDFEGQVNYFLPEVPTDTVQLQISTEGFEQTVYYDKDNKPIVNSASQPFDPTLERTYFDAKFTISWKTLTAPPVDTIMTAAGQVNSDSCSINIGGWSKTFTARMLKLVDPSLSESKQGGNSTWSVSVSFICRTDTFAEKVLDQGYGVLDGSGKLINAKDNNGDFLNAPLLLDGSGHALAIGGTPVYLTFKVENETAFASIFAAIP